MTEKRLIYTGGINLSVKGWFGMSEREKGLFTSIDYTIVRAAVKRLPGLLAKVIELRFWQHYTVAEIGEILGVSDREVEKAIQRSYQALRNECLRHPTFSRSLYSAIKKMEMRWSA